MYHRIGKHGKQYWGKKGAGYIFTDGTTILLLKRNEEGKNKGQWGIPGGKHENSEAFIDTARRETKEEIGRMPECDMITYFDTQDGRHVFRNHLCRVKEQFSCKLDHEHTDYKWVPFSEIKGMDLHPRLREIMDKVISAIKPIKTFQEWLDFSLTPSIF